MFALPAVEEPDLEPDLSAGLRPVDRWLRRIRSLLPAGRRDPVAAAMPDAPTALETPPGSLAEAGMFFFWAGLLAALSYPVAARLSRRIGLVNTMVFTHIPSSVALMLAALAPSLEMALICLLVRAALSQMDVPARSSYVMAVVTEAERPAAASFTSVPRSLASALSPSLAGALFAASAFAWPLLICGTLKIAYDLLLLAQFRHVRPPEED